MKKLFTFIAASILCFNLYATNNTSSTLNCLFDGEEVIVTPDTIHLFFHGCSPHGEFITITNNTSDVMVINRFFSDITSVECFYDGENIFDYGMFISPQETVEIQVFVPFFGKSELDAYGTLYIDTDYGIYSVTIFHENYLGIDDHLTEFEVFPNPANNYVSVKSPNLGSVSVYNALGQKVDEFTADHGEIVIPSAHYSNGIYFVRTDLGETKRVIINH